MARELISIFPLERNYGNGAPTYNENGLTLNSYIYLISDYVPINPTGKTYYYDVIASIAANNHFYIGFHRYDANKTNRSNNACVYIVDQNKNTDQNYVRFKGTVDLSTDGVNPTAFIKLRILNAWTDSTHSETATIHYLSLKEVTTGETLFQPQAQKTGILKAADFSETNIANAQLSKNGLVLGGQFYEN